MVSKFLSKIFGSRNERVLKRLNRTVATINGLEEETRALSDEQLKGRTYEFRKRFSEGESLDDLLPQTQELADRVEALFLSLDAGLKFKIKPIEQKASPGRVAEQIHTTDLRGVACPLNFVKAKLELEKIEVGAVWGVKVVKPAHVATLVG